MFAHMALHEKRSKLCFYRLLGDRNKKNDWWIDIIKLGINHQESWPKWPSIVQKCRVTSPRYWPKSPSILQKCIVTSPKILTQMVFHTPKLHSPYNHESLPKWPSILQKCKVISTKNRDPNVLPYFRSVK